MKSVTLAFLCFVLLPGIAACTGAPDETTTYSVNLVQASSAPMNGFEPGRAGGHHGGFEGHCPPHGDGHWGGGCHHDSGPDATVGDEDAVEDVPQATDATLPPDDTPAEPVAPACAGTFELRAVNGLADPAAVPLSTWRAGPFVPGDQPLLYVIGIREPSGFPAGATTPMGETVLHIGPTQRPLVLALASDLPTDWILDLADGTVLEGVIALGSHPGAITNFAGEWPFWLDDRTYPGPSPWGTCWPPCDGAGDPAALIAEAEAASGLHVEAFDGAYHLEELTIRHLCTGCTPQCDGRECGPDGCGDFCGTCGAGDVCRQDGLCIGPQDDLPTGTCPGPFALRFFEGDTTDVYPHTFYRAGPLTTGDQPLMHLIGIYEANEYHIWNMGDQGTGRAVLHIGPMQRPEVLVLSAYDSTEWVLDLDPAARIQSVVLMGYSHHSLVAPAGIPVRDLSGDWSTDVGYCWPFCEDSARTAKLVEEAESATGMTLEAFDGTYHLREAWIHHTCTDCTPDCGGRTCGDDGCGGSCGLCRQGYGCSEGRCVATVVAPACSGIPADTHYCLTLTASGAALLGLETGSFCSLGPQTGVVTAAGLHSTSIAWQGDYVYSCRPFDVPGILRFSLVDGTWDVAPLEGCQGVASWNGGLAVLVDAQGPRIRAYASFDDAVAGRALPVDVPAWASRLTVQGDTAYAAWHSTGQILRAPLPGGPAGNPVTLEGFDNWVEGLSVTDDGLLVIDSWWPERRIAVFDAATGQARWNLTNLPVDSDELTGLACRTH